MTTGAPEVSSIERVLTDPRGFGLTGATNCQRAICRALDGVPLGELWDDGRVQAMFGGARPPEVRPEQFVLCAGIRTFKSLLGASLAWTRTRDLDLSRIPETEAAPILPLVSVHLFNARACLKHLKALIAAHPEAGEHVEDDFKDSVAIRNRHSGRLIENQIVAGGRAATNLASFWHVSVIFDEVFALQGARDAVANLNEAKRSIRGRVLPGGQILYIGSPIVSAGPGYELVKEHWGNPSEACMVARAPGRDLNPVHWTEDRERKLRDSVDQDDRDAYVTGALGEFLDALVGLLSEEHVSACTRPSLPVAEPREGMTYGAAIDPATRRNAWTLVIAHRDARERLVVDLARQWQPRGVERLDPEAVLQQIADATRPYRVRTIWTDQWCSDMLRAFGRRYGLRIVEREQSPEERNRSLKRLVDSVIIRELELPPGCDDLGRDLRGIRRRATRDGARYELVETVDGRHCDFAPPLAVLLQTVRPEGIREAPEVPGWIGNAYPDAREASDFQGLLLPAPGADPVSSLLDFTRDETDEYD